MGHSVHEILPGYVLCDSFSGAFQTNAGYNDVVVKTVMVFNQQEKQMKKKNNNQ